MKKLFQAALVLPMALCGAVQGIYSPATIKIDGRLHEPVWAKAPKISSFTSPDQASIKRKTEAQIVFTPQAVVFGFKAYIPQNELKIIPTKRDQTAEMDCVEVMIDTAGAGDNYKHIIVHANNGIFDRYCEQGGYVGDDKWDGDITSAVQITSSYWSCEILIPYHTLGLQNNCGRIWKINLCRESFGLPSARREISSICRGAFNTASDFLPLPVPERLDLTGYQLDLAAVQIQKSISGGRMALRLESALRDVGAVPRNLQAELLIPQPGAQTVREEELIKLEKRGSAPVVFDNIFLNKPGKFQGVITVRDHASNRILLRRRFPVDGLYTPITIKLIAPHYRDAVFATQKLKDVRFRAVIDLPENARKGKVTGGIRKGCQIVVQSTTELPKDGRIEFTFPVEELPEGKLEIFVSFGKDEATHVLRKLPYKQGEVWRGTDGNWYRDGKKLFILSGWNGHDYNRYYNIVVRDPKPGETFLFYNIHPYIGIGKVQADIVNGKLTPKVKKHFQAAFDRYKDHPLLFGYFLCDEPAIKGFARDGFRQISEYLIELDPYHPFMVAPGTGGVTEFADSAEISGFHCYPKVERHREMANFEKIVFSMERIKDQFQRTGINPTITFMHQGFDYSHWGTSGTRIPTYEEFRNQNLLSLILGGRGLLHYNRAEDNFPELSIGMPYLTREQQLVGNEAIIEPDAAEPVKTDQAELRILAKRNQTTGEYWVLACNASHHATDCSFRFSPFANRKLRVLSEDRTVTAEDGAVRDHFKPFEVHIYTTDRRNFDLTSVTKIKGKIAAAYQERRRLNAGNLLYQEHENDTVRISASSNKFRTFRAEDSLWHLTDGLTGDPDKPAPSPDYRGIIVWQDATPNVVPDHVTIQFKQPLKIGRVEVYPAKNSVKDFEIQLLVNGEFHTVGQKKNAVGAKQVITFPPQEAEGLRLIVTANRGAYTKVFEIKAFEK